MRQNRPSQFKGDRSADLETQPFLDASTVDQAYHNNEQDYDRRHVYDQPGIIADAGQQGDYMDPTYARQFRASNAQQDFASHAIPRGMFQENIPPDYPEQPHPDPPIGNAHQSGQSQVRQPLRPVPIEQGGQQSSMRSQYLNPGPRVAISPLKAGPTSASPMSSPFFQRDYDAHRMAPTRRPLHPAGNREPMREPLSQRDLPREMTGHSMQQQVPVASRNIFSAHHGQRFFSGLQKSNGFRSFGQIPSSDTVSYRGPTAMSQAPQNLRRSRDTRGYAPSLQHPLAGKQPIPSSKGRITLPPSATAIQDRGLASIHGVRGGLPHRAEGFSTFHNPAYNNSRPLFSAVSRRSVRR